MHDIFKTLDQTEWWYGQDGYPYKVSEMEQSHRINVVNFLLRRAHNLYDRYQWREFRIMESAPEGVFNQWMDQNERTLSSKPEEWLQSTPLMQALEQAIRNHNTIDGEVVTGEVVVRHQAQPPVRFS